MRGILLFIIATLALSYAAYGGLLGLDIVTRTNRFGTGLYWYLGIALIPGIAGAIAQRFGARVHDTDERFWPGFGWTGLALVGTHAIIVGHFLLQWGLGYLQADWSLPQLYTTIPSAEELGLPFELSPPSLLFLSMVATVLGGLIILPVALAHEFGWRWYFYQRLVKDYGRLRANVVVGVTWGLCFTPLIASGLISGPIMSSTLIRCFLMTLAFGTILSELYRRSRSLLPPAIAAGAWLAHLTMPWHTLFVAKTFPYTWHTGWVAVVTWGVVAMLFASAPGDRRWLGGEAIAAHSDGGESEAAG